MHSVLGHPRTRRAVARPVIAFVLAPFLMWVCSWLAVGLPISLVEGLSTLDALATVALRTLIEVGPWAYAAEAVVGIPAYLVITRRRSLDLTHCVWVGAAAGIALGLISPIRDPTLMVLTAPLGAGTGFAFWSVYALTGRAGRVGAS